MSWLLTLAIGGVIFLIGAIVAIGVRPREEDIAAERARREERGGDGGGGTR